VVETGGTQASEVDGDVEQVAIGCELDAIVDDATSVCSKVLFEKSPRSCSRNPESLDLGGDGDSSCAVGTIRVGLTAMTPKGKPGVSGKPGGALRAAPAR
jgi:hypothetical protein